MRVYILNTMQIGFSYNFVLILQIKSPAEKEKKSQ